ncbi:uncharacterized protein LOC135835118 [Planococcus citri]|uniref:uncharacterized protein LOC135835118 n=1 Tax=Planococcus citri TaxID=170843 RepID=UPI0031F8AB55
MLANAKRNEEDEMLDNEMATSQNGSSQVDMNNETDCKSLKLDITSAINENVFDVKDVSYDVRRVNGDSDPNDWLSTSSSSSSSSSSDSESDHNVIDHIKTPPPPHHQSEPQRRLSNESSHFDDVESPKDTNGSLNGSMTRVPVTKAPFTKKVRPLKICFGVKNSVNGLKVKNSKLSNDSGSKVHYIERPPQASDESDDGNLSEPEPEPEPEYAQYLGLKPSVKFKCSRCGVKNFASMALLNEHMASCDGQTPLTVSTAVPSSSMMNGGGDEMSTNLRITRKVYLCSSCGTYYQSYDLFIHMREKHQKQICLVCFNMFAKSQQLCDHLISAHNLKLGEYTNVLQIRNAYKGSFYITCCTCNRLFSEDEPFDQHICEPNVVAPLMPPAAPVVRENASVTTRDNITDSKLPYKSHTPLRVPPTSNYDLSPRLSSPESVSSPTRSPDPTVNLPQEHEQIADDTVPSEPDREMHEEPAQSPMQVAQSTSPVQRPDYFVPDEPASHVEPELRPDSEPEQDSEPLLNDTITPTPYENSADPEYCEPVAPETYPEEPEAAERVDAIEEAAQSKTTLSDDDSLNASSPNRLADLDEPAVADTVDPATAAGAPEEEKIAQPLPMALMLDEAIASLDVETLMKECIRTSCTTCAYCYNATLISVNAQQLGTHLLTEHRYKPTKNEDDSEQVEQKIRSSLPDLQDVFLSASSSSLFDGTFSCFQCSFTGSLLKELGAHNRKAHQMTIFLCCICKCSFIYYSEILCHECPGEYSYDVHSLKYRCCFCPRNHLPSAFRLMIHLRKHHKSCNFCLQQYNDQYELFAHMTKQHKMPHLCYKCNIAYRSRNDINKHLFWKHGTESVLCQRCLQKKWPHTYHFCMPGTTYTCDECSRVFSKAVALTVHRRAHNGEFPFACETCDQRFISKKLVNAHRRFAHPELCKPEELLDPSTTHPDAIEPSKPDENSDGGGLDTSAAAERQSDDATNGKKRRKKKRSKKEEKLNEKPLLDELPPLNLSSESDDESGADEESPPKSAVVTAASTPKPDPPLSPQPTVENEEAQSQPQSEPALPPVAETEPVNEAVEEKAAEESDIPKEAELPVVTDPVADPVVEAAPVLPPEPAKSPSPSKEQLDKELLEKTLNCVLIEHSYCIPESIFHSANVDLNNSVDDDSTTTAKHHRHEGSVTPERSQHRHDDSAKTADDSCCKSASSAVNTPRKRKHAAKNKTSSAESASSSSSSDSDSSSSSCGSNCSCNRSNSGCSSSSSAASDCSTTPEKKKPKKSKRERDEEEEKRTQQQREQMFLLDARESDLDTEISSAGEEFYEERPCYVPPPPPPSATPPVQQQQQTDTKMDHVDESIEQVVYQYDNQQSPASKKTSTKSRSKDKKKKKKRIKLSLAGRIPPNCAPLRTLQQQQHHHQHHHRGVATSPQSVPNNEFTNPELLRQMAASQRPPQLAQQYHQYHPYSEEKPLRQIMSAGGVVSAYNSVNSSLAENCVSNSDGGLLSGGGSTGGMADDSNSRLSKRKRVKNKFYGYSTDDEAGRDSSAPKSVPKKRVLTKKPSQTGKSRQPFIGIRAKLTPMNKRLSISLPFTPVQYQVPETPPVSSVNNYRSPQTQASAALSSSVSSDTYNPYRNRYSSSEDSDSDEKRHTLVINLPNPMKKKNRSRVNNSSPYNQPPPAPSPSPPPANYSDDSMSSNSYVSSPPHQHQPQPEIRVPSQYNAAAAQQAAAAAAMRQQQLYRAKLASTSGAMGVAASTNSPLKNSEKLYCYCQCPYDEVSEMIGCDAPNCKIEWFHFECVGIMVPPKGKWYCPSCRRNRENVSKFV